MTSETTVTREEFEALKKDLEDLKKGKIVKKKVKREPTAYNKYMSEKMLELRKKHPDRDHKTIFKDAVEAWKKSGKSKK